MISPVWNEKGLYYRHLKQYVEDNDNFDKEERGFEWHRFFYSRQYDE